MRCIILTGWPAKCTPPVVFNEGGTRCRLSSHIDTIDAIQVAEMAEQRRISAQQVCASVFTHS